MRTFLTRILTSVAFFAFVAVVLPPAPTLAESDHTVPFETPVYVRLVAPLSSYHAYNGMEIPVRVIRDVVVDGCVVIARGAHGIAQAVAGVEAAPGDQPGEILLQMRWVRAVDHTRIGVIGDLDRVGHPAKALQVGEDVSDAGYLATSAGFYVAGSYATLAGNAIEAGASTGKGSEVTIGTGEIIEAHIADTWGVIIPSDIPALGEDSTPIR